jgi:hypothetical protein
MKQAIFEEKIEKPLRFRKNFSGVLGKRAF